MTSKMSEAGRPAGVGLSASFLAAASAPGRDRSPGSLPAAGALHGSFED